MGPQAGVLGVTARGAIPGGAGPLPRQADVLVIGGGPAGCAAAITARREGARVLLLERDADPRERPGETLHPGIEPLLAWLGAGDVLAAATLARHRGHWVRARGQRRFLAFGADETGTWRGFQAWRQTLDAGLRARAADLGALVRSGVAASGIRRAAAGRVTGVTTRDGRTVGARVVIDASGGRHWLARALRVGVTQLSPRYLARFGYAAPAPPGRSRRLSRDPELFADARGWTWIAPLGDRGWHWTRLSFASRGTARGWMPPALAGLPPTGPPRGADVTWRRARSVTGPGWLMAGDAGAVLDPASSHGVLRALLTGARAGTLAAHACRDAAGASGAWADYDAWFRASVSRDVAALRSSYRAWSGRSG
jgi:flavin-dependent dehydrogenase